ncbi:MAG: hypothetical protein K0S45_4422 [Nitrospira sp.]|jgi:hypothetical protein|nr:hypothetical protein [Nitrospira sp.]
MRHTTTIQGDVIMSSTLQVSCRVDYRPTNATHFCEYSGRVGYLSATGCTIQATQRPDPGTTLELRLYVPGSAWPIRVTCATVAWSHWDEFTVEFVEVPFQDQDQLQRCLAEASALVAG